MRRQNRRNLKILGCVVPSLFAVFALVWVLLSFESGAPESEGNRGEPGFVRQSRKVEPRPGRSGSPFTLSPLTLVRIESTKIALERFKTRVLRGRPVISLRIWGDGRPGVFRVELFEPGELVVLRGRTTEQVLSQSEYRKIVTLAERAAVVTDFCGLPFRGTMNGTSVDMEVLLHGRPLRVACLNIAEWPQGENTRQLIAEINGHLDADMRLY